MEWRAENTPKKAGTGDGADSEAPTELVYESVSTERSGGLGVEDGSLAIAGEGEGKTKHIPMASLSRRFSCRTCREWPWEARLPGQVSLMSGSQNTLSPSKTRTCVFLSLSKICVLLITRKHPCILFFYFIIIFSLPSAQRASHWQVWEWFH